MEDINDTELRNRLLKHGINIPITDTSRSLLKKKLQKLATEGSSEAQKSLGRDEKSLKKRVDDVKSQSKNRLSLNVNVGRNKAQDLIHEKEAAEAPARLGDYNPPRKGSPSRVTVTRNLPISPASQVQILDVGYRNSETLESPGQNFYHESSEASLEINGRDRENDDESVDLSEAAAATTFSSPALKAQRRKTIGTTAFSSSKTQNIETVSLVNGNSRRPSPARHSIASSRFSYDDEPSFIHGKESDLSTYISKTNAVSPIKNKSRYNSYLKFFQDNASGSVGISRTPSNYSSYRADPRKNTISNISEDEDDDYDTEPRRRITFFSPASFKNMASSLSPSKWFTPSPEVDRTGFIARPASASFGSSARYRGFDTPDPRHPSSVLTCRVPTRRYFSSKNLENVPNTASHLVNKDETGGSWISTIILIVFLVGLVVVGLCYLWQTNQNNSGIAKIEKKSMVSVKTEEKLPFLPHHIKSKYPICGLPDVDLKACVRKDHAKIAKKMFDALKAELLARSNWAGCGTEVKDRVDLATAKTLLSVLTNVDKTEINAAFYAVLIFTIENPDWGLKLQLLDEPNKKILLNDFDKLDDFGTVVYVANASPTLVCRIWTSLYVFIYYITLMVFGALGLLIGWKIVKYRNQSIQNHEKQVFEMVEKIIHFVKRNYDLATQQGTEDYVAMLHIRDELIAPKERKNKSKVWDDAIKYILRNESRIRQELQRIRGEEYLVFRWAPTTKSSGKIKSPGRSSVDKRSVETRKPSLYPDLSSLRDSEEPCGVGTGDWQGQAFAFQEGSPNSLFKIPSTCLKIRHMFENLATVEEDQSKIKKALIQKCEGVKILHIGIDVLSRDGCVYVKLMTKEDARIAYLSLHGWWYAGHLLSVKFLREERYNERFPEAKKFKETMSE